MEIQLPEYFYGTDAAIYKNGDTLLDRKYAAMHHLSMNVTKWLNIGLFEGVIFGRKIILIFNT